MGRGAPAGRAAAQRGAGDVPLGVPARGDGGAAETAREGRDQGAIISNHTTIALSTVRGCVLLLRFFLGFPNLCSAILPTCCMWQRHVLPSSGRASKGLLDAAQRI